MSRLPTPGGDNGNWGAILNDYLQQSHNDDGSIKASAVATKQSNITVSGVLKGDGSGNISAATHGHGNDIITPSDVVNNLTSTVIDVPLSANQGNVISTQISQLEAQIGSISAGEYGYTNATGNGVTGDGTTNDSSAIQSIISSHISTGGEILFEAKTYNLGSDITILSADRPLRFVGHGAKFIGSGKIIIDSCKNVSFDGFDMHAITLSLRGCWYLHTNDLTIGKILVGDAAGTSFSDNYWNCFINTGIGQLYLDVYRGCFNSNQFYSCIFRGDNNQGYLNQQDYNIYIAASSQPTQASLFEGCDISYATDGPIYVNVGNTRSDTSITFRDCYFDTNWPDITQNAIIDIDNCITGAAATVYTTPRMASKVKNYGVGSTMLSGWTPTSAHNFFKDGTFMTGIAQGVVIKDEGTTLTYSATGGPINGYMDINQPLAQASVTYFMAATVPLTGYYSMMLLLKNNATGSKNIRVAMNEVYFNVTINDTEWTRVGICSNSPIVAGNNAIMMIYTEDEEAYPYNIRVGCCGIMFGRDQQLIPVPDYKAYIDSL